MKCKDCKYFTKSEYTIAFVGGPMKVRDGFCNRFPKRENGFLNSEICGEFKKK